jgi:outer membrane protein insertion porin family
MLNKLFRILVLCSFFSVNSLAEIIKDVEIVGNKRLSKESIIVFAKIKLGEDYDADKLNDIFKNLYNTDFFKDINIKLEKNILHIDIIENFIIEDISYNGVKNKKIVEAISDISKLKSRSAYTDSALSIDVVNIKNLLQKAGYYFADVKTSLDTNIKNNTVKIIYNIDLGEKAKISKIVFVGDKKFKNKKLSNIITSEENRFWKFISSNIYLDRGRIDLDKRLLEIYYKNNGYYDVVIEETFAEFQDDNSFKLIFNIDSGLKYYFNDINLILPAGYAKKDFSKFNKLIKSFKYKKYSLKKIENLINELDKFALQKDYEFIDASITEQIVENNKLNFDIIIKESEKYYVEKINIIGNSYTLEEVIRNSLIVDEGDPYNEILFNKSINKIKGKNIFKTVTSDMKEGSSSNTKIIELNVVEKPTGEISLGAGAGTTGATIGGGIKENNFMGKGIKLNTNVSLTKKGLKGSFSYEQPNFNYTDNSLLTSFTSQTTDNISDFGYKTGETTFALATRFQQYDNLYFSPELLASYEELETTSKASSSLKKQEGSYFDTYFNYSLDLDHRNQTYQPSDGTRYIFNQELPIISETSEILNTFEISSYKSMPFEMIGKASIFGSHIRSLSDKDVRISKRAYLPARKLRGFESGKIGPIDNSNFIGGNYVTSINMATTLPQILPSFQNTDFSLFVDAASIWGVDYSSSVKDNKKIRSATGIAVDVLTPVGPMNFSWSIPITKANTDITETFRFNIGTTF